MQQSGSDSGSVVVLVSQSSRLTKSRTYSDMGKCLSRQLIGLGVAQAVVGLFCLIIQGIILEIVISTNNLVETFYVHGIWTGIVFLITGLLGIWAGIGKGKHQVVAFNILSIISTIFAFILLIIACLMLKMLYLFQKFAKIFYTKDRAKEITDMYALQQVLIFFAVVEIICAIWSSIVCCAVGACCCRCKCWNLCCLLPKNPAKVQVVGVDNQQHPASLRSKVDLKASTDLKQNSAIATNTMETTPRDVALNEAFCD